MRTRPGEHPHAPAERSLEQAALNDRETLETEVISASHFHHAFKNGAHYSPCRATHPLVFQYREARDDRHGAESYLTHACKTLEGELASRAVAGALQA